MYEQAANEADTFLQCGLTIELWKSAYLFHLFEFHISDETPPQIQSARLKMPHHYGGGFLPHRPHRHQARRVQRPAGQRVVYNTTGTD